MFFSYTHGHKSKIMAVSGMLFLSSSIAPFISLNAVQAQSLENRHRNTYLANASDQSVTIPAGTEIPVEILGQETLLVRKGERAALNVTVSRNLNNRNGQVLIPRGSVIEGQIEPSENGARFVARSLLYGGADRQGIYGASWEITRTEIVAKGASTGEILLGALGGALGGVIIAGTTGDKKIDPLEVGAGAGVGVGAGLVVGRNAEEMISINTDTDLNVVLSQDLILVPYDARRQINDFNWD